MVVHGKGVHLRRVQNNGPVYEPIAKTHARIAEIAKAGKFGINAIYEWYSLDKINSVPSNKAAFPRGMRPNCLVVVGWSRDSHSDEKTEEGRLVVEEIASSVSGGEIPGLVLSLDLVLTPLHIQFPKVRQEARVLRRSSSRKITPPCKRSRRNTIPRTFSTNGSLFLPIETIFYEYRTGLRHRSYIFVLIVLNFCPL